MQALVKSTWLAVAPGRDSLLLGSQNNTPALPASLTPLWSSNLVALSSCCPLTAIQNHLTLEGCLWSLACQSISLGNKANCPFGPTVFLAFLHSLPLASCFICLSYLVRLWPIVEFVRWRKTINTSCRLLSLHNVPPLFCSNCLSLSGTFHNGSRNTGRFHEL